MKTSGVIIVCCKCRGMHKHQRHSACVMSDTCGQLMLGLLLPRLPLLLELSLLMLHAAAAAYLVQCRWWWQPCRCSTCCTVSGESQQQQQQQQQQQHVVRPVACYAGQSIWAGKQTGAVASNPATHTDISPD
jgi:hypothetical protein